MGALTSVEIFEALSDNLKQAAERCEQLAWHPRRGHVYWAFRDNLKLAEGACRQVGAHREDARWFPIGLQLAHVHKMCGNWMRSSQTKDARNAVHRLFGKTAEILRALAYQAEQLKNAKTGRSGMLLPQPITRGLPQRVGAPVQVKTSGGLILPPTYH